MSCEHEKVVLGFSKKHHKNGLFTLVSICIDCKEVVKDVDATELRKSMGMHE